MNFDVSDIIEEYLKENKFVRPFEPIPFKMLQIDDEENPTPKGQQTLNISSHQIEKMREEPANMTFFGEESEKIESFTTSSYEEHILSLCLKLFPNSEDAKKETARRLEKLRNDLKNLDDKQIDKHGQKYANYGRIAPYLMMPGLYEEYNNLRNQQKNAKLPIKYSPELETLIEKGAFPEFGLNTTLDDITISGVPDYFYDCTFVEVKTADSRDLPKKIDLALLQLYLYDFLLQNIVQKEMKMPHYNFRKDVWIILRDIEKIFTYRVGLSDKTPLVEMLMLCGISKKTALKSVSELYNSKIESIDRKVEQEINQIMFSRLRENRHVKQSNAKKS